MKRLVVIGNGMAACRLLEELTHLAPDLYQITVVGEEPFAGYNRVMLSPLLCGGTDEKTITTYPHQWYRERSIRLITGSPVVEIHRHRRQFQHNHRMRMIYRNLDRMDPAKVNAMLDRAEQLLADPEAL